jgi:hypothetical protein
MPLAVGLTISLATAVFPFGKLCGGSIADPILQAARTTPEIARLSKTTTMELDSVLSLVHADDGETLLVVLRQDIEGPNARTLVFDKPSLEVASPYQDHLLYGHQRRTMVIESISSRLKRLLWLHSPQPLPMSIWKAFPKTQHLYTGSLASLWASEIGTGPIEITIQTENESFVLHRGASPSLVPPTGLGHLRLKR